MNFKKVFKKSKDVVSRNIEGQVIIMPLYKSSRDLNCIYTLNETAAAAWDLIDGKNDLNKIKEKLLSEFDVTEETLKKNMEVLIKDLKSIKAVA